MHSYYTLYYVAAGVVLCLGVIGLVVAAIWSVQARKTNKRRREMAIVRWLELNGDWVESSQPHTRLET